MTKPTPKDNSPSRPRSADTIFAKITPAVREDFRRVVRDSKAVEKDVIERLVEHFISLKPLERIAFVEGSYSLSVDILLARDRALTLGRSMRIRNSGGVWSCVGVHRHLLEVASGSPEIQQVALYKLSYAFISIGEELLKHACSPIEKISERKRRPISNAGGRNSSSLSKTRCALRCTTASNAWLAANRPLPPW